MIVSGFVTRTHNPSIWFIAQDSLIVLSYTLGVVWMVFNFVCFTTNEGSLGHCF